MGITNRQTNPGENTLIFSGPFDFTVRKEFKVAFQEAQTKDTKHIILNLADVSFIDCAAIGLLVQAKHEIEATEITLTINAVPGRVLDVLKLLNLDEMFSVTPARQNI